MQFLNNFKNKKVMVTGHTGFKGSWLSVWLNILGAEVIAVSKDIPTQPSHYELFKKIFNYDYRINLENLTKLTEIIKKNKPDYLFHLAAQPIVLQSYTNPYDTFSSNSLGTLNILEALKRSNHRCSAIFITSDKCYENINQEIKYKETDRLGGIDPYSTSKASAELIIKGYYESFFKTSESKIRISSARAGNVMGGGDWAEHRIVPDCIKSWNSEKELVIRNANATRPWQHVLEPVNGYLTLASLLNENTKLNGESFNFGPSDSNSYTVESLVIELAKFFPGAKWSIEDSKNKLYEANLLSLDCMKAKKTLGWEAKLNFNKTAEWTSKWYHIYYNEGLEAAANLTKKQISEYSND